MEKLLFLFTDFTNPEPIDITVYWRYNESDPYNMFRVEAVQNGMSVEPPLYIDSINQGEEIVDVHPTTGYIYTFILNKNFPFVEVGTITPPNPTLTLEKLDAAIYGQNGRITASVTGGKSPYTLTLNDSQTLVGSYVDWEAPAGIHIVRVVDANGGSDLKQIEITQPTELKLELVEKIDSDFGQNNGFIKFNVQGGVSPYSILESNNLFKQILLDSNSNYSLNNLSPKIYYITIRDKNGSVKTLQVQISEKIVVNGCTIQGAENYNPNATTDDGSCYWLTEYTGNEAWLTLEEYFLDDNSATGNEKPNVPTDPDYIEPILNEVKCPSKRYN